MMAKYINWSARAEDAEQAGDWAEAKRCWYYAAQELNGNPYGLRTRYGEREDRAEEQRRRAAGDNNGEDQLPR